MQAALCRLQLRMICNIDSAANGLQERPKMDGRGAIWAAAALLAVLAAAPARADDETFTLSIEGHRFAPTDLEIPAGKKITLIVKNLDKTPEEFESTDLRREKVVTGGDQITVYVGPLRPGRYEFFGDFNPDTARGHIIAK
jgi:plastocyanin